MQGWRWALAQLTRRLWVRASIYGVLGVAAALLAAAFSPFVPDALAKPFGGGTAAGLLNILATSLLSVATFSTAAMITAYTNVSTGATPRAAALITSDSRAQGALASFVGAFLYSVVAFSALGTGYYANGGRAILFGVTLLMLLWVAITLLLWLDQLLDIARVGHAIDKVEDATRKSIASRFGAELDPAGWTDPPETALAVESGKVGYVANVDVAALRRLSHRHGLEMWVVCGPGAFAHARRALLRVHTDRALSGEVMTALRTAFDVADGRSFDQDPRFGFVVLGEVAAKALSPGINDPGTAIDVIGTAVRLLTDWRRMCEEREPFAGSQRVHMRPPAYDELLDDVFRPIATYGASDLAVSMRLQKAFAALAADAHAPHMREALRTAAEEASARALAKLDTVTDKDRLRRAYAEGAS